MSPATAPSRLDIHRRNRGEHTLVTLAGDIGPATTPLLRTALEQCLLDGVTVIDIDLATVGSCDARGLNVLMSASRRAGRVHTRSPLLAAPAGSVAPGDPMDTATRAPGEPARQADQRALKDAIRVRRLTRRQVEDMCEDIADLAAESVAGTPGEAYLDRADFLRRLAVTAHRPGFALLVAETTVLVGYAYGVPVGPDGSGGRGFDATAPGDRPAAHLPRAVRAPHPGRAEP